VIFADFTTSIIEGKARLIGKPHLNGGEFQVQFLGFSFLFFTVGIGRFNIQLYFFACFTNS